MRPTHDAAARRSAPPAWPINCALFPAVLLLSSSPEPTREFGALQAMLRAADGADLVNIVDIVEAGEAAGLPDNAGDRPEAEGSRAAACANWIASW